ncbi:MAG: hypothetical protein ILM98_02295 [Kiritimatiellae bacterium]|nr:hypothetical protein [Kiritimatiellia bacterium]
MKPLRNITLEISSKALVAHGPREAARTMFRQWRGLADKAGQISVLLWTADGSELLDWSGDFSDTFEWACWCGCANHCPQPENPTPRQRRNTHQFPAKMFPEEVCAPRPYAWLRDAVAAIRAAAREELGREVRVGTTFDNGPEFAISDFKYNRHREVMLGNTLYPGSFLVCSASLHADTRRYAAFPTGIPEGLSVGAFLGAQYRAFARDFGFDYIWLSNGMGFGSETWGITGALFDKKAFHPEHIAEASEKMRGFWRDFFAACPDAVVETRGSNFSAGLEISTDAAPLGELYASGRIEPPVNSPWAALNFNIGLELAAWMSHVAELPKGRGMPFRFYTHDPWFMNSPWLDRYNREPWDLFAPLSVARMREDGSVQTPDSVAFLSVDDTHGEMPEEVPREVTPLLLKAIEEGPDRPGPIVWVYPFGEYSKAVIAEEVESEKLKVESCGVALSRIFNEDFFLGEALQGGLPLNTVISTRNWRTLAKGSSHRATEPQSYSLSTNTDANLRVSVPLCDNKKSSLFILPVSSLLSPENLAALDAFATQGAKFLVYGSLDGAPAALLERLGLALAEPLEGEFTVEIADGAPCDTFASGALATRIRVNQAFDGGGLAEVAGSESGAASASVVSESGAARTLAVRVLVEARQGASRRVLAARCGAFAWVRSITPCDAINTANARHFDYAPPTQVFPVERLMRHVLGAAFGWSLLADAQSTAALLPRTNISRHDNAFIFTVYAPDTTASMRVRTPYGAPLLTERETLLANGEAIWHPDKSWRRECRLFADGQQSGTVSVKTSFAAYPGFAGRLQVKGLDGATLRFFPPLGFAAGAPVSAIPELVHSDWNLLAEPIAPEWEETPDGPCAVWRNVTGPVFIAW